MERREVRLATTDEVQLATMSNDVVYLLLASHLCSEKCHI